MKNLKTLMAAGLISVGSLGAGKAYAENVTVPDGTEIVNLGQFMYKLHAPLHSLKARIGGQELEIRMAETTGDTIGIKSQRERIGEESERKSRLEEAVISIQNSVLDGFEIYNIAIGDRVLTSEERMLLPEVILKDSAIGDYCEIAGSNSYDKVNGAIEGYNQTALALRILAEEEIAEEDVTGGVLDEQAAVEGEAETGVETKDYEEEQDYTKMTREVALGATGYNNNRVGGFARVMYGLNDKHNLGVGIEYGEQVNKDVNTLATQRNPITGARLEASEQKDKSSLEAGLEWSYDIGDSPLSLRAVLGAGRITLDRKISERLYDKKDNPFGSGNKDFLKNKEWYGKFLPGFGLTSGNVNLEGYIGVVDKKAEVRTRVGYRF